MNLRNLVRSLSEFYDRRFKQGNGWIDLTGYFSKGENKKVYFNEDFE
jgi:hypothetical protein